MLRIVLISTLVLSVFGSCLKVASAPAALPNDVYVWQRLWTPQLNESILSHATNFSEFIALHTETLRKSGSRIGFALRIATFSGPFNATNETTRGLIAIARSLLAEAQTNHISVAELQMDFDCPESKLDGFAIWVGAIRKSIEPIPLTITALPNWLKHPGFKRLVNNTDGFVLQVHSLKKPGRPDDPFTLCDPRVALEAVEQAGQSGVPFRVALPTYGYLLAFNPAGEFRGLSAEGFAKKFPENSILREVRAQPNEISQLVREWGQRHPIELRGIIWYRLPAAGDQLNWSWPTLASVMAGKNPQARLRSESRKSDSGLFEIDLINDGDGDYQGDVRVEGQWKSARLVASDGWLGFECLEKGSNTIDFVNPKYRISAGERRTVGWFRLSKDSEVQIETHP